MHYYECVVPNVDIDLQSERFWAMSIASFRERLTDFILTTVTISQVFTGQMTLLSPSQLIKALKAESSSSSLLFYCDSVSSEEFFVNFGLCCLTLCLRLTQENSVSNENDVYIAGFSDQILRYAIVTSCCCWYSHCLFLLTHSVVYSNIIAKSREDLDGWPSVVVIVKPVRLYGEPDAPKRWKLPSDLCGPKIHVCVWDCE